MFKKIVILIVILVAVILVYAATKPDTFSVQRTTSINAPDEKIFPLVNDLHKWDSWSPYEKKDPAMKRTFSGTARGKGSAYAWEGNKEVGKGSIEITETSPPSRVRIRLDMLKPIEGHNIIEFSLEPKGEVTDVTWAMHGTSPYISKVMSVFINLDTMIGTDFEAGLANLKAVAEK